MTLLSVFKLHIDGIPILLQHFSQQYDYEIYLCKCMDMSFTNFNCCKELHSKKRLQFIHLFCYWWTFEVVSNSTVITNCYYEYCCIYFIVYVCTIPQGHFTRSRTVRKCHVHLKLYFFKRAISIYSPTKCVGIPISPSLSTVGIGIFTNLTNMKWFFIVDFILSSYYSGSFSSSTPIMSISVQKENLLEIHNHA